MNPEDVILSLFGDYILWCDSHGIPHDTYEDFYNTVRSYDSYELATKRYRYRKDRGPIQPNDEERAVAEVIRMLGGEG